MQSLERNGVRLAFDTAGSGAPPILFVHGWCCDHSHFAPQVEHFKRRHRVVAVDLRGHGESDKPQDPYTMASYADDLAWLSDRLGLQRVVVVGHSMGGVVAAALAADKPGLVAAVVLVDAPSLLTAEAIEARRPFREALHGPDYASVATDFVRAMFLPTDDPDRRARITAGMLTVPQHVMASSQDEIARFDMGGAVSRIKQPLLYIGASAPRGDANALKELAPQLMAGQVVGAGHFCQLEAPEQVNAMIERFLVLTAPA